MFGRKQRRSNVSIEDLTKLTKDVVGKISARMQVKRHAGKAYKQTPIYRSLTDLERRLEAAGKGTDVTSDENALALSFTDVLSCGLAVTILIFLLFSVLSGAGTEIEVTLTIGATDQRYCTLINIPPGTVAEPSLLLEVIPFASKQFAPRSGARCANV